MASAWYNKGKAVVMDGTVDLVNDTIKVILVTSSYSFNADHDFADDVSANEISVTGYTGGFNGAGRKTLASKTVTVDNTNDRAYFDAADLTWTSLGAGATVGGAVLVKEITNDAATPLIGFIDFSDTATNGNDFTVSWDSNGILRIT